VFNGNDLMNARIVLKEWGLPMVAEHINRCPTVWIIARNLVDRAQPDVNSVANAPGHGY
jgi:hypothetical protein